MFGQKYLGNDIPIRAVIQFKMNSTIDICPDCEKEEDSVGHALMRWEYVRIIEYKNAKEEVRALK